MPYKVITETDEYTVVSEYQPDKKRQTTYQSEAELEKEFISMLCDLGYEYLDIHHEDDLIANLRTKIEELNNIKFSDKEWKTFFNEKIANANEGIVEKTKKIQENYIQELICDDGSLKNVKLIDKEVIHNNKLQVVNQYETSMEEGARHNTRYDVTVLVNGLPLVHIELKRRGVPIKEAFNQINRYQRDSFFASAGLFEYVQIFVISNGTNTKYYSNTTRWNAIKDNTSGKKSKTSNSFEFASFWADANNKIIPDLIDFTKTFFARHTILNILTKYCVFTSEDMLLVMRPYQIVATEKILNKVEIANHYKKSGSIDAGGYIWHTTGSGKTLTSFKTARLATELKYIDKVLFVVDRKDLDYQTMKEYDRFEKGAANGNTSTRILKKQLENSNARIVITTIQKLSIFIKQNPGHQIFGSNVIIIFDECHRSQFGDMHKLIIDNFKHYFIYGFTGTPIFAANSQVSSKKPNATTEQVFGSKLHAYTIVDAINDKNVLPFKIDYIGTIKEDEDVEDENVFDINREKAYMAPERITNNAKYILEHFNQKTYRKQKYFELNKLTNISEVASAKKNKVSEVKAKSRVDGFNSILATNSIPMAKAYYTELKELQKEIDDPLKIAIIYSYSTNNEEEEVFDDEDLGNTSNLNTSDRDFLDDAINDYNIMFHTNYSTDGDQFENYYKDVSLRMKNKELDILIVVNMFLTGFDSPMLNTLWVDKNLKMHGLIQAFSRTNRILNSVKTFGNIICFRPLSKRVDDAIALFGDKDASGIVLLRTFNDYFYGYNTPKGHIKGYKEYVDILKNDFPLSMSRITGESKQKEFIELFGSILRIRNILVAFDDFNTTVPDELSERDMQDYLGRYQDLKDEWRTKINKGEITDIDEDVIFETELIKQIEVNIDYILALVKKLHDSHNKDIELKATIERAIDSSPSLRSKKELIKGFIENMYDIDDFLTGWRMFVADQKENDFMDIVLSENLNEDKTRELIANSFRDGELKVSGSSINAIMPPTSRFGKGGQRIEIKARIIAKLFDFFEKYFGLFDSFEVTDDIEYEVPIYNDMVAERPEWNEE